MLQMSDHIVSALSAQAAAAFATKAAAFLHAEGHAGPTSQRVLETEVARLIPLFEARGIVSAQCMMLALVLRNARGIDILTDPGACANILGLQEGSVTIETIERAMSPATDRVRLK